MNRLIICCYLCCLWQCSLLAQGIAFDWVRTIGGTDNEKGDAIKRDAAGNIYLAGSFENSVDFDPGPDTLLLTPIGGASDIFVLKLDPQGNLLWAHHFGGQSGGLDAAYKLALDSQGNVLVAGTCLGVVDFDPGPGVAQQTANGEDIFVLKLTSNGEYVWAHVFDGNFKNRASGISTDANGDVVVTGRFFGTVDFDPGANTADLTAQGGDAFILKLDANGNHLWAKQISGNGTQSDEGLDLIVDGNGDIITVGHFLGTADLDPGLGTQLETAQQEDVFVVRLNAQGDFVWGKKLGGTGRDYAQDVVVDGLGNFYLCGYFDADFDADPSADTLLLSHQGGFDYFVEKLDINGSVRWAHGFGGGTFGSDLARGLALDPAANLYITGRFGGSLLDFDPGPGVHQIITEALDIFVQKLDSSGNFLLAKAIAATGSGSDIGEAVAVDDTENVYLTGAFYGLADFNTGPDSFLVESQGASDIYVLKLSPCTNTTASLTEVSCGPYTAMDGQVFTESGSYTTIISNAVGCDSVISIDLTVNQVEANIDVNQFTLTAQTPGLSYQWLDCGNDKAPISGETEQSFTATSNGSYAVAVANAGCTDTSECVVLNSVSIEQADFASTLSIYPNPSGGQIQVLLGQDYVAVSAKVYTLMGQLVMQREYKHSASFDLFLPAAAGAYFLKITTSEGESAVAKVWKQ